MDNDDLQATDDPALRNQLDSGVSVERLRHEQEQARYNELYLLAPVGYFVLAFEQVQRHAERRLNRAHTQH